MGFVVAVISLTIMAFIGVEIYKMYKKDRDRVRRERALEESVKREKQRRMQSWSGGKDFWD